MCVCARARATVGMGKGEKAPVREIPKSAPFPIIFHKIDADVVDPYRHKTHPYTHTHTLAHLALLLGVTVYMQWLVLRDRCFFA